MAKAASTISSQPPNSLPAASRSMFRPPEWQSSTADCQVRLEQLPETGHGLSAIPGLNDGSADRDRVAWRPPGAKNHRAVDGSVSTDRSEAPVNA